MKNIDNLAAKGKKIITNNRRRNLNVLDLDNLYNEYTATAATKGGAEAIYNLIIKSFHIGIYEGQQIGAK